MSNTIPGDEVVLEVQKVTKVFPGTVALKDVSIKFLRGEIHGVIGKNGAGKSTLVKILSGILQPTQGNILISGKEFSHLNPSKSRKQGISIITQKPEIVPAYSVVQNLFLPNYLRSTLPLLSWRNMKLSAKKVFDTAGIAIDISRKMSDLSFDEVQMFLLVKAFYLDKKSIVLIFIFNLAGGRDRTRTCTDFRPQRPQRCAYTISATRP